MIRYSPSRANHRCQYMTLRRKRRIARVAIAPRLAGEAVDDRRWLRPSSSDYRRLSADPVFNVRDVTTTGGLTTGHACDQFVKPERCTVSVARRIGAILAKRPSIELRLIGEDYAGHGHHQDHAD